MNAFRALLTASGLSQREAAQFLVVAYDTVRGWLSGRRATPLGAVEDLKALVKAQERAAMLMVAGDDPVLDELPTDSAKDAAIGRAIAMGARSPEPTATSTGSTAS